MATQNNDFSKGPVWRSIFAMAVPTVVAQCVQVLYNIVDRVYIGHIPGESSLALTGVGLTFPVILLITAFANLYGQGGGPLCSIYRGSGDNNTAGLIMGNCFVLLTATGAVLTVGFYLFMKPLLFAFGASEATWPYAQAYLQIYLAGTVFNMLGLGLNSFINAQGFGRVGMLTTLVGCLVNFVLDPVFIFVLGLGVRGAALATVLSQILSAVWVLRFLTGPRALFRLCRTDMPLNGAIVRRVLTLGFASFIMAVTSSLTQVICNAVLSRVGGDIYVGIMTVVNSIREVTQLPCTGFSHGCQPVLGFNYGARKYRRTRQTILWSTGMCLVASVLCWVLIMLFPGQIMGLFSSDETLIAAGIPAVKVFFFGYFFMAFQFSAQSTYVALGRSRQAIFFSILRKVVIVTPLTLALPGLFGLGVMGVFLAEPISNLIGSVASYGTLLLTVWPELGRKERECEPA